MILRKFDKDGNRLPDVKCQKCGSDSFAYTYFNISLILLCKICRWCTFPDENSSFYLSEEEIEKYFKNYKPSPAVPFLESNCQWQWMPFTKEEAEKMVNKLP